MNETEQFWQGRTILRWMMTQWCNYNCWYCRQDHSRKQTYKGGPGHWIDAASLEAWQEAFCSHFDRAKLTVLLTGGEPFIEKQLYPFLQFLEAATFVEAVRVDTNAALQLPLPLSKVQLMMSYHPTETTWTDFFARLDSAKDRGWQVPVVNFVVDQPRIPLLYGIRDAVTRRGCQLNVLPMFGDGQLYSESELAELREYIPAADWPHRIGEPTVGKPCLFPSVAWEMDPAGQVKPGCYGPKRSFFDKLLPPLPGGYVPCPDQDCFCVDKYSFLHEMDANGDSPLPMVSLAKRIKLL